MNKTVLRWFGQRISVGILTEENGVFSFLELANRNVPFASSPIIAKSPTLEPILLQAFVSLVSSYSPSEIEVWLPVDWGMRATVPAPALANDEIVDQLRWEVGFKLNDDIERFLFRYAQRSDGQFEIAALRPAVYTFWRNLCESIPCKLTVIRIGSVDDTLDSWQLMCFNENVSQEVETSVEQTEEVARSKRKVKLFWPIVALILLLAVGGLLWWQPWVYKPKHPIKPVTTPIGKKVDTVPLGYVKPDTLLIATTPSSTQPNSTLQAIDIFTKTVQVVASLGQLETAVLTTGEAMFQLVVDGDRSTQTKAKLDSAGLKSYQVIYDGPSLRFSIFVVVPTYPIQPFSGVSSSGVRLVGDSWEGKLDELMQRLSKQSALPYRITYIKAGEVWRAVITD
ncbi:MAG: hypothetical protein OEM52_03880 [bacterium]|nr:hypothetical protein [bacterium]